MKKVSIKRNEVDFFIESEFTELKKSFSDEVIETLVAFSNFKGGKVIVGVDEKKKEIVGVKLESETLQNWLNEIKNKTQSYITPDIYTEKIEGKIIVIFSVIEFPLKPVAFKNRYFIRKNNSNHKMSLTEVSDMFLRIKRSSWDFYDWENATLNDLDNNKISKVKNLIEKNLNCVLGTNQDFLNKYELINKKKISNAAMLLFSKDSLRQTDIQIGLFQDDITIKKNKIIRADLITEVEEVMDFIEAYILKEFIITGNPQREERWQYPIDAIREFVINSIIHRDYRDGIHTQIRVYMDKINIYNSGTLPFDLTLDDVKFGKEKSKQKNLLIAEIFRDAGLIERYGSGVSRAITKLSDYGLDYPEIRIFKGGFDVTLYGSFKKNVSENPPENPPENLTELEKKILSVIEKNLKSNRQTIAKELNLSSETVKEYIVRLKNKKVLERIGSDKGGHWRVLKEMGDKKRIESGGGRREIKNE